MYTDKYLVPQEETIIFGRITHTIMNMHDSSIYTKRSLKGIAQQHMES